MRLWDVKKRIVCVFPRLMRLKPLVDRLQNKTLEPNYLGESLEFSGKQ